MTSNYNQMSTFLGYSEDEVGVIAGGGVFGFGGVVIHEPTEAPVHRIVTDPEDASPSPKGIGFNYASVATITVSGILRWTNATLSRAPQGRQDVRETGQVRIEIFDNEGERDYVEASSKILERLGIHFIG
jgi:hypothetical protein